MAGTSKGCSGPCTLDTVFNGMLMRFVAGVAAVAVTSYKTESARHLTITDGSIHADSNGFAVGPAALASFEWSPVEDQTAGVQFHPTATAYDRFGNVKTDYNNGAALSNDMSGTSKGCSGPSDPCTPETVFHNLTHFAAGPAGGSSARYKTESARHLTITDGSVAASSNAFTVGPAALASFEWNHVNDQTA